MVEIPTSEEDHAQAIYDQVTLALKSNQRCGKERKDFAICRATQVGRSDDPSFCDSQAASLIHCHILA